MLKEKDLANIFKNCLISQNSLRDLCDFVYDENVIYDQYYQRSYVWNEDKASYFIESILIGTEIPPIVTFETRTRVEIIDGRQRYETLKRFLNNEFKLKRNGLHCLKQLANKYFKDLKDKEQDIIRNTYLRIYTYSVIPNTIKDNEKLEHVKKEIFKRYNIGLTPLKQYEIEKAIFVRNNLNEYVKQNLLKEEDLKALFCRLFFKEKEIKGHTTKCTEIIMKKFRFLITLPEIPINYYSWNSGKNDLINSVFKFISNDANPVEVFKYFSDNVKFLTVFTKAFEKQDFSANNLIYEVLFWAVSIIKKSGLDWKILETNNVNIVNNIIENQEIFETEKSHYYANIIKRYKFVLCLLKNIYHQDFEQYITTSDYSQTKIRLAKESNSFIKDYEYLNYIKKEPVNISIKLLCDRIQRNTICIRPHYQREEAMDVNKASSLIESILLGCRIAPIYFYTRLDGTTEVLDGQQRLLAILGFMGISFHNLKGEEEKSNKSNFKLTGLKYLTDLNRKQWNSLSEERQTDFLRFSIPIIELREENMKNFDPIDLFVRLNNKPYPIREHSFEMWNAILPRKITDSIKKIANDNSDWFYLRTSQNNKRMQNEEMITNLLYLVLQSNKAKNKFDKFKIFAKSTQLACMLQDKRLITNFLLSTSDDEYEKLIKKLHDFINKLKEILYSEDLTIKKRLQDLLCPHGGVRTLQTIFLLFYILSPLEGSSLKERQNDIYDNAAKIISYFKQPYIEEEKDEHLIKFNEMLNAFWNEYKI